MALDIAANGGSKTTAKHTLCERAYAGLIRTRARELFADDHAQTTKDIPSKFWWSKGHEALDQNWTTGDFSTWIDKKVEVRAFGVSFALDDVLDIIPVEQRALVALKHSVAGNPDWISAKAAATRISESHMIGFYVAAAKLIELARLGFVTARSLQMSRSPVFRPEQVTMQREWDVPTWFWNEYCEGPSTSHDWELGSFKGESHGAKADSRIELTGVHFLASTINAHLKAIDCGDATEVGKPPLPEAELKRWWDGMAASRESLTQGDLLLLIRAKYPDNHIARDRIREISGGRKPGKKAIGG